MYITQLENCLLEFLKVSIALLHNRWKHGFYKKKFSYKGVIKKKFS